MIVFYTDLDNTIIYSYKHDIGNDRMNVEIYQGRELSYITSKTYDYLNVLKEYILIVPVSTRTTEQYHRINLKIGRLRYALVCNGGILLRDGERDEDWYSESLHLADKCRGELSAAMKILADEPKRKFEIRLIENLFVFTKCGSPETAVRSLREKLDLNLVEVLCNGEKVYVVPKELNKGNAVRRFGRYIAADLTIAAGDSEFDCSMLKEADIGIAPAGYVKKYGIGFPVTEVKGQKVFSDEMLEKVFSVMEAL